MNLSICLLEITVGVQPRTFSRMVIRQSLCFKMHLKCMESKGGTGDGYEEVF